MRTLEYRSITKRHEPICRKPASFTVRFQAKACFFLHRSMNGLIAAPAMARFHAVSRPLRGPIVKIVP
jgi:hypothetical protein